MVVTLGLDIGVKGRFKSTRSVSQWQGVHQIVALPGAYHLDLRRPPDALPTK